jgi:hypothetical protein
MRPPPGGPGRPAATGTLAVTAAAAVRTGRGQSLPWQQRPASASAELELEGATVLGPAAAGRELPAGLRGSSC